MDEINPENCFIHPGLQAAVTDQFFHQAELMIDLLEKGDARLSDREIQLISERINTSMDVGMQSLTMQILQSWRLICALTLPRGLEPDADQWRGAMEENLKKFNLQLQAEIPAMLADAKSILDSRRS